MISASQQVKMFTIQSGLWILNSTGQAQFLQAIGLLDGTFDQPCLWAEGSKSSGWEGGHRTGQSLISIFFHSIFNSFHIFFFSKMLSPLDFTFSSFCPGASLGRGNSFGSQLLTGMLYHYLSRQTGACYWYTVFEFWGILYFVFHLLC